MSTLLVFAILSNQISEISEYLQFYLEFLNCYQAKYNLIQSEPLNSIIVMKTALLVVLALIICLSSSEEPINDEALPKLPMYAGLGFNLIEGNPLSNSVDPGFKHPTVKLTYNKNKKTDDGRYLIPDGVLSRLTSSCSFTSSASTSRGTQSYRQVLDQKVSYKIGIEVAAFQASYSHSRAYQTIYKSTIEQSKTVTQVSAECDAYVISLDLFSHDGLEDSFINGVNQSYANNNWDTFIQQYGTHYVSEVVMGGRAMQEMVFTFESMSTLQSLEVDVNNAARARFAKMYGDKSFDWKKYDQAIKYSQYLTNQTSQMYIGGHPPRDGNIMNWVDNVITNPMPIRYTLAEVSQLFSKIKLLPIALNLKKVEQSYVTAVSAYCKRVGCKAPEPDRPKPAPATVNITKTDPTGIDKGSYYQYSLGQPTIQLQKVMINSGSNIDRMQFLFSDGAKKIFTPAFGNPSGGGIYQEWVIPQDEELSGVQCWFDTYWMKGLMFMTNKGHKSPLFGTTVGQYRIIYFPQGYRIIGLYGKNDEFINLLGFVLGKNIYPPKPENKKPSLIKRIIKMVQKAKIIKQQ